MADAEIKEVSIEVAQTEGQSGGGGTRRRRRARRSTRTQEGGGDETAVAVEKAGSTPALAPAPAALPPQTGGAPPKVVIAPAKKKLAKVMLVPKATVGAIATGSKPVRPVVAKTFKAKRVHLTIDNTAHTVKRRRLELGKIDAMSDEQVRDAAVMARLAKRETVAKAPPALLRQMLKDYRTMRGQLL